MKYDFEFSWDSTYGYASRLVGEHALVIHHLALANGFSGFD